MSLNVIILAPTHGQTLIKHERQRRGLFAQQTRGRDNNTLALRQLPPSSPRKNEI